MTERRSVELAEQALHDAGTSKASASAIRNYLQQVRELQIRESTGVLKWGSILLAKHARSMPFEEAWLVKEQVAIAAMDCSSGRFAYQLVENIRKQFPKSRRADRLTGMYNSSRDREDGAEEWYSSILIDAPNDPGALRRRIAAVKAAQGSAAAIPLLVKHVEVFQNDLESWQELAELYLQVSAFQQAAFCYEELLMHEPAKVAHHLLYAECQYSLHSWRTARTYYSSALQLTGGQHPRALYGIAACTAQLAGQKGPRDEHAELGSLAAQSLVRKYREEAEDMVPYVKALLKEQDLK